MAEAVPVSGPVTGTQKNLSFSGGKLAQLANGAVVGQLGNTVVLVTATAAKAAREGTDFFPLTVDIEERMYAAGKIPGSFFRRAGRALENGDVAIMMVEAGGTEDAWRYYEAGAPKVTEEVVAQGLEAAKQYI